MVHSALFTPYFRYFMLPGSQPGPFLSPAIRRFTNRFRAVAVALGKWAQSACCQAMAPGSPMHTGKPQITAAPVNFLQGSWSNATGLL